MENVNSNEDITDITEVLEITKENRWLDRTDVSEYKWKLVSDNQNEPTQVHFYKEDMTDTLSINLSTIFDRHLREYKRHLFVEEDRENDRVEREKRVKKDELLKDKIDEVIESYELFLKQQVKDEIIKQNIKPNQTSLRKMVDEFSKDSRDRSGIHFGLSSKKSLRNLFISKEWYLENYDKLKQIILSYDPDYETTSPPCIKHPSSWNNTIFTGFRDGTRSGYIFLTYLEEKYVLLLRKMKNSPIGYWRS